jgi:hypothetical protein
LTIQIYGTGVPERVLKNSPLGTTRRSIFGCLSPGRHPSPIRETREAAHTYREKTAAIAGDTRNNCLFLPTLKYKKSWRMRQRKGLESPRARVHSLCLSHCKAFST